MKNVAVIGAGLSGLSCAHELKNHVNVMVFDKSRGVSGRMSTRYTDEFEFDHGAQYFTARHADFQSAVLEGIHKGHIAPWQGRAAYKKKTGLEADKGADRFAAIPRMNSWSKSLAAELDVKLGTRISNIKRRNDMWMLRSEAGESLGPFHAVILAIPAPQAQALLPEDFNDFDAVKQTKMDACFALMLGFDDLPDMGWDSLRVEDSAAAWLAINSRKPNRPHAPTMIIHANPKWSNKHANDDREWLLSTLLASGSKACDRDLSYARHIMLHRWLYASVSKAPHVPCLYDRKLSLGVCGDWCLGGRVENAYLSGQAAAHRVLSHI